MAPYAKKEAYSYEGTDYEADIQNGDKVEIKNDGQLVPDKFGDGEKYEFLISTRNGDRLTNFNQSSVNVLVDAYGEETLNWVGKEVKVLTKKGVWGGKKSIAAGS